MPPEVWRYPVIVYRTVVNTQNYCLTCENIRRERERERGTSWEIIRLHSWLEESILIIRESEAISLDRVQRWDHFLCAGKPLMILRFFVFSPLSPFSLTGFIVVFDQAIAGTAQPGLKLKSSWRIISDCR